MIEKTQMTVAVDGTKVVIQFSRQVVTQWLTAQQARLLAGTLEQAANIVEAVSN